MSVISPGAQRLLVRLSSAKAQFKVFYNQLAHLLREGPVRGQLLKNFSEDDWVSQVVVGREHEESILLLDLTNDFMRVFL